MQLPVKLDPQDSRTLQVQLFDAIRQLILSGRIKPGMLMPSTRSLSQQLGVSRNTVALAYNRLIDEDYLYCRKTVGTFVNASLPEKSLILNHKGTDRHAPLARQAERHPVQFKGRAQGVVNPNRHKLSIDFWVGRPDPHSFPISTWRRLTLHNLAFSGSNLTEYNDPAGIHGLREAIADYLGPARGIDATPEQVIVVSGSQQALNLVARLMIGQGATVVTECPCYQGAAYVFESYGAQLYPVKVDHSGLDVSRLPDQRVSLAYVTPSHQYPMGATMTLDRRLRLLDWAWETGAYIVEDDYDSDFRHHGSPLTAVAGLDPHGCVIYMGTFSKSIGAGLRLGYLVIPEELVKPASTVKALMDNGHPWLDQAVLADFITSGAYARHLRRIRHTYLKRRDCLIASLRSHFGKVSLSGLEGGMHIVWHLPRHFPPAVEVQEIAQDVGVGLYALEGAAACEQCGDGCGSQILVIGYSSVTEEQIREGITRLANAL